MSQIDLMKQNADGKNGESQSIGNSERLQDKRPEKVNVERIPPVNQKWNQCKILGKNISIRSYSAGCTFGDKLYIHGGYQILNGVMSDFYYLSLDKSQQQYSWTVIEKKGQYPGHRARHAMVASKSKMYLFGGLQSDVNSTNSIFQFDPATQIWKKLETVGEKIPCLDSFGCTLVSQGEQQKIIVFGGYSQNLYEFTNAVYEYNIQQNKWSVLSPHTKQASKIPQGRSGCAISGDREAIYIFGGKNEQAKLNDLWKFDLKSFKFTQICQKAKNPISRNGHSLTYHQGILYLFGGIHDITWQLDDLHMFDINKKEWIVIEYDSPRKAETKHKPVQSPSIKNKNLQKNNSKKKNWYETSPTIYNRKSMIDQSPSNKGSITHFGNEEQSPGKMIDQQRKKAFMNRKVEMLKNFEINQKEKQKLIQMETTSQAMKNTLDVIGNVNPQGKVPQGRITDFGKTTVSKFLQPLTNSHKEIEGKKPCARDGHVAAVMGQQIIIFAGDRHQMSFNDIFRLNLKKVALDMGK